MILVLVDKGGGSFRCYGRLVRLLVRENVFFIYDVRFWAEI